MKEIPMTQGLVALVDDEDAGLIGGYKWRGLKSKGAHTAYAYAQIRGSRPKRRIYLHRLIMNAPAGIEVDHINGNGLDNRRANLRLATRVENSRNVPKRPLINGLPPSSKFKGVTWSKYHGYWAAQVCINRKHKMIGYFASETDAALAYNAFVVANFGEFALPNEVAA
jgi:hypothetical protein